MDDTESTIEHKDKTEIFRLEMTKKAVCASGTMIVVWAHWVS